VYEFGELLLHTKTMANGPISAKFAPLAQTSSYATGLDSELPQMQDWLHPSPEVEFVLVMKQKRGITNTSHVLKRYCFISRY